jgi:Cys-tRNA(Pro) deacylase
MNSSAIDHINSIGLSYKIFIHHSKIENVSQAARERGQHPSQIVRSIVFRTENAQFCMALIPGGSRVDWKHLRRYLGVNRITLASEEEVLSATGYKIGTVTPFGLKNPLRMVADVTIQKWDEISIGSGVAGQAIILQVNGLIQAFPDLEWGNFIENILE